MRDRMNNNAKRGDMREYKGQTYICSGHRILERRDGTETWLTCWRSLCLVCLKEITFEAPMHVDEVYPLRRCKLHTPKYKRRKWRKRTT